LFLTSLFFGNELFPDAYVSQDVPHLKNHATGINITGGIL